jgi:hypothetical protein
MSRDTVDTPTIVPVRSAMGDSVTDTLMAVPSLRTRSDRYSPIRSPRVIAAWISLSSPRLSGRISASAGRPIISAAV